jgi:hypothetical protein
MRPTGNIVFIPIPFAPFVILGDISYALTFAKVFSLNLIEILRFEGVALGKGKAIL